ncbi:MAG: host attachment protein [Opitutus sp.]
MNEHYIVTVDRGHLRIYSEGKSASRRLEVVESLDFPTQSGSTEREVDGAVNWSPRPDSGLIEDLRLSGKAERRCNDVMAAELDSFLQNRPGASWDLAVAPSLFNLIIDRLSPGTRRRLKRALSQALANLRVDEVRAFFATAGS